MAFNLADMVNKRPKQVQQENTSDTVYRDVFELVPSKENFYGTDPDRLQGLKNSIQLFGVMQDVLIEDVNGEDHIISGHCRTMCCRMLVEEGHEEFRKINCKYTTVKDDTRKMFLEDGEEDHETTQLLEKLAVIQANRFREKTDWEKMKEALETEEIIKGLRRADMPNVRPLNRKKYNISKRAFQTAYNYCLQYTEWKEELAVKRDTRAGQNLTGQPGSHNCSDSTADAAMEAGEITHKIKKIEDAAMEAVGKEKELYPYLLHYVTTEYCTFQTMKARGIPCERSYFYEMI